MLLAELLTDATYPDDRVEGERDRVAERIAIARSQPGVIARTALAERRYGEHPYAIQLPDTELVAAVDGAALRAVHRSGAARRQHAVLVGDLDPQAATDAVGTRWRAGRRAGTRSRRLPPTSCGRRGSRWSTVPAPSSPTSASAVRRRAAPRPTSPPRGWPA